MFMLREIFKLGGDSRFSRILIAFFSLIIAFVFGFIAFGLPIYFFWTISVAFRRGFFPPNTPSYILGENRFFVFITNPSQNIVWAGLVYVFMGCAVIWAGAAWIDTLREDARSRRRIEEHEEEEERMRR